MELIIVIVILSFIFIPAIKEKISEYFKKIKDQKIEDEKIKNFKSAFLNCNYEYINNNFDKIDYLLIQKLNLDKKIVFNYLLKRYNNFIERFDIALEWHFFEDVFFNNNFDIDDLLYLIDENENKTLKIIYYYICIILIICNVNAIKFLFSKINNLNNSYNLDLIYCEHLTDSFINELNKNKKYYTKNLLETIKTMQINQFLMKKIDINQLFNSYFCIINKHIIKFEGRSHTYFVDGKKIASVTQIIDKMSYKYNVDDYNNFNKAARLNAAKCGIKVHMDIENYENNGTYVDTKELNNYIKLKNQEQFKCLTNELILLYCNEQDVPIYCGRCDLVIKKDSLLGIAEIKRTSKYYSEKVFYQLNLYKLAYEQSYGMKVDFLNCIWLKNDISKFIKVEIDEGKVKKYINDYLLYNSRRFY